MKILILSQVYWPDTASVSQHLTDLAEHLAARGHEIQVISSRKGYENPEIRYPDLETVQGVSIHRIWQTGFGKGSNLGRLADFLTFNLNLCAHLVNIRKRKYDLIIGTTVPPMVSLLGVLATRLQCARFCYWVMDLQPELAIAVGMTRSNRLPTRVLLSMGNYIFLRADRVIALDKYMQHYIEARGTDPSKIAVIPVWPVMNDVYEGERMQNPFRKEHDLGNKIVVMYSGNHSVVHPLDTLLDAALRLRSDPRFLFLFIGGGIRKKDVLDFREKHSMGNIKQLPYQERERIHLSLGAGDIHVVILGNGCVGYTHPNKIYGAMFIGRPILFIGPKPSHIADILSDLPGNIHVGHGEVEKLAGDLLEFANIGEDGWKKVGQKNRAIAQARFGRDRLMSEMANAIESLK